MLNRNLGPNDFTYTTLIDGLCKNNKLSKALEILDDIWGNDITLDILFTIQLLMGAVRRENCRRWKI